MRRTLISAVVTGALAASVFAATPANAAEPDISGSGSSFANNFVTKCAAQYQAKTGNKVTYTSTGSGTGRTNFATGTSDFAFTDAPVQPSDKSKPAGAYVTVPVIGGAIAIVHSVAGVKDLQLDAATLGGIFSGTIAKWNDPANAIGYVDLSDIDVKVGRASIKNAAGKFVKPSVAAAAAMLSKQSLSGGGTIDINYTQKVKGAYQISLVTYALIPKTGTAKGAASQKFVEYAVSTCSKKPAKGYSGFKGAVYSKSLWFAKQGN